MAVIIHGPHRFLERFSQRRCSGNHGGGRKKHTKTKVGRKRLPGFRLNWMQTGPCSDDEWWAIYFLSDFCWCCILTLAPLASLRGMARSPLSLWCTVGDLYVLYVATCKMTRKTFNKMRLNRSQTHCWSEPWAQPPLHSTRFSSCPCLLQV